MVGGVNVNGEDEEKEEEEEEAVDDSERLGWVNQDMTADCCALSDCSTFEQV